MKTLIAAAILGFSPTEVVVESTTWTAVPQTLYTKESKYYMLFNLHDKKDGFRDKWLFVVEGCKKDQGTIWTYEHKGHELLGTFKWSAIGDTAYDQVAVIVCEEALIQEPEWDKEI